MSAAETSDDYTRVIVRSNLWRVVRCKSDMQYIVQRRTKLADAKTPWVGVAFILNESWLPAVILRPSEGIPPDDAAALIAGLSP